MRKSVALTTVAPVLSNEEINARLQVALRADPALALALATKMLGGSKATRTTRSAMPETETERVCRCAGFVSGNRSKLLIACVNALGEKNEITITEADLMSATSLPSYRVRADMQTVQDRLNDTDNVAQFPFIREAGYKVHLKAETRGVARSYVFSRIVPVAAKKTPRKVFKGKAVTYDAAVAETKAEESKS
jgi:hypothetical protein